MEKERLNHLINKPTDAVAADIPELEDLIKTYPYSQTLHILLAKITFLLDYPGKSIYLKTAAIYASQRGSLKRVIEESKYPGRQPKVVPYQDIPAFETFSSYGDDDSGVPETEPESTSIFREVMRNLEKLKALREQFQFLEISAEEASEEPIKNTREVDVKKDASKKDTKKSSESAPVIAKTPLKPQLQVITPLEEKLDIKVNEFFLSEIQKKEPTPEIAKQESDVQTDLIDKFIKAQPSIGTLKKEIEKHTEEGIRDLSERSTSFGDNLISENLAVILLKQGKKERAVEIYKKLIWKLPQKKAYFAARIEEINK